MKGHRTAIPPPGLYPERLKAGIQTQTQDTCSPVFAAALFTTAQKWKQPECPLMDKWTHKMSSTHTMEEYLVFKRKEILRQAPPTRAKLEDTLRTEQASHKRTDPAGFLHRRCLEWSGSQRKQNGGWHNWKEEVMERCCLMGTEF